jgi:hypothetical protein
MSRLIVWKKITGVYGVYGQGFILLLTSAFLSTLFENAKFFAKFLKTSALLYETVNHDEGTPSSSVGESFSQGPLFDLRSLHVRFVLDKETTEQVSLQELRFSPESITQPLLHSHLNLYLHLAVIRRTKG